MIDKEKLAALRQDYSQSELSRSSAAPDPFEQFSKWFAEAIDSMVYEPNAMTLGTSSSDGLPSGRTVLLKGFDASGFTFFTNYNSRKASALTGNPNCFLHFLWKELERQIIIVGRAEKTSEAESDEYFSVRPYASQIGAWASDQSSVIASREVIEDRFAEYAARFAEGSVPRPPHWGGFRVTPHTFEFWQGRPSRLHDRLLYNLEGDWQITRLAP